MRIKKLPSPGVEPNIDKLINSQKNQMKIQKTPLSNRRYCKMKYIPGLFEKLRHAFFRFGVNLVVTPPIQLKYLVSAKIDPIAKDEVSGVYIIPLKTENIYLEYIGMTSRKLKVHIKEHLRDLKYNRQTTALSRINQKKNIQVNFEDTKIICP